MKPALLLSLLLFFTATLAADINTSLIAKDPQWFIDNWPDISTQTEYYKIANGEYIWKNKKGEIIGKGIKKNGQHVDGVNYRVGASDFKFVLFHDYSRNQSNGKISFIKTDNVWKLLHDDRKKAKASLTEDVVMHPGLKAQIWSLSRQDKNPLNKLVETWPDSFKTVRMKLKKPISTKKEHLKLIESIPKKFYNLYKIGDTAVTNEWFVTSLDPDNSAAKESLWIIVIATKKNGDYIYTNSVW